ncbi:MAG: hypothetical protein ACREHD_14375 [Pirellulales bacterium]
MSAFVRPNHRCRWLTGLLALLSVLGCSHGDNHAGPPTASKAPVPPSPLEVTRDAAGQSPVTTQKQAVPFDESDEWVPMTGSEKVIVHDLSQLTDGAAVEAVSAAKGDDATNTKAAAGTRPTER